MRFNAQRTMAMQDMMPAGDSVYQVDLRNTSAGMLRALRAWEKKRGLSMSFHNGKKAKEKSQNNRPK